MSKAVQRIQVSHAPQSAVRIYFAAALAARSTVRLSGRVRLPTVFSWGGRRRGPQASDHKVVVVPFCWLTTAGDRLQCSYHHLAVEMTGHVAEARLLFA